MEEYCMQYVSSVMSNAKKMRGNARSVLNNSFIIFLSSDRLLPTKMQGV